MNDRGEWVDMTISGEEERYIEEKKKMEDEEELMSDRGNRGVKSRRNSKPVLGLAERNCLERRKLRSRQWESLSGGRIRKIKGNWEQGHKPSREIDDPGGELARADRDWKAGEIRGGMVDYEGRELSGEELLELEAGGMNGRGIGVSIGERGVIKKDNYGEEGYLASENEIGNTRVFEPSENGGHGRDKSV